MTDEQWAFRIAVLILCAVSVVIAIVQRRKK